jgi:hypothetical protein
MKGNEQHIQSEYIHNVPILPNWNDRCNADMNELGDMVIRGQKYASERIWSFLTL